MKKLTGFTDEDYINFIDYSDKDVEYLNEYERQILEKDKNNNDYKIIKIDGDNRYSGYMAVIYDPSRIEIVTSADLGTKRRIYNRNV